MSGIVDGLTEGALTVAGGGVDATVEMQCHLKAAVERVRADETLHTALRNLAQDDWSTPGVRSALEVFRKETWHVAKRENNCLGK